MDGSDEKLDALFRAYREACPDPEPSANFMPGVWQRIEARRNVTFSLRRMAGAFATAALAFSLAIGVYSLLPSNHNSAYYAQSYVEALASAHGLDADSLEPAHIDMGETSPVY